MKTPALLPSLWLASVLTAGAAVGAPVSLSTETAARPGDELLGGDTTVFDATKNAFSLPVRNIAEEHRAAFFVGNSFFNQNWVGAPASVQGRDGLGPLFNTRSCSACHFKDGRSGPPAPGESLSTMILRISVPGGGAHGEPAPDPVYGGQIQNRAIPGVTPEADVLVEYERVPGQFGDGEEFTLRKPTYSLRNLGYGPAAKELLLSPRVAPSMIGLGLLEAIPEETLRSLADPQDENHDGISGRLNLVWDQRQGKKVPGRFGWKAEQPNVFQQTAGAFVEDIGITSSLNPDENLTPRQRAVCRSTGAGPPEVSDEILKSVVLYSCLLGVPARRNSSEPTVQRGRQLFSELQCAACHVPEIQTGVAGQFSELSHQTARPYSDLLLHDLGEGLADHRPVFDAGGSEWRTAPLWGIGLVSKVNGHTFFLHDGRARNLLEAILWHGGEAKAAQEAVRQLPRSDRQALIAFLESL
jgi:CxxC motif-containing protein (DUF1111 family)